MVGRDALSRGGRAPPINQGASSVQPRLHPASLHAISPFAPPVAFLSPPTTPPGDHHLRPVAPNLMVAGLDEFEAFLTDADDGGTAALFAAAAAASASGLGSAQAARQAAAAFEGDGHQPHASWLRRNSTLLDTAQTIGACRGDAVLLLPPVPCHAVPRALCAMHCLHGRNSRRRPPLTAASSSPLRYHYRRPVGLFLLDKQRRCGGAYGRARGGRRAQSTLSSGCGCCPCPCASSAGTHMQIYTARARATGDRISRQPPPLSSLPPPFPYAPAWVLLTAAGRAAARICWQRGLVARVRQAAQDEHAA